MLRSKGGGGGGPCVDARRREERKTSKEGSPQPQHMRDMFLVCSGAELGEKERGRKEKKRNVVKGSADVGRDPNADAETNIKKSQKYFW